MPPPTEAAAAGRDKPMATHRVSSDNIHTYWSNALTPVLTIQPGETVVFETLEASYGHVARNVRELAQPGLDPALIEIIAADAYPKREHPDRDPTITGGHALTGPVAIEGAEPGDTLVVEIVDIAPAAWGYTSCSPRGSASSTTTSATSIARSTGTSTCVTATMPTSSREFASRSARTRA
jgi:acetamidase/formamidase